MKCHATSCILNCNFMHSMMSLNCILHSCHFGSNRCSCFKTLPISCQQKCVTFQRISELSWVITSTIYLQSIIDISHQTALSCCSLVLLFFKSLSSVTYSRISSLHLKLSSFFSFLFFWCLFFSVHFSLDSFYHCLQVINLFLWNVLLAIKSILYNFHLRHIFHPEKFTLSLLKISSIFLISKYFSTFLKFGLYLQ